MFSDIDYCNGGDTLCLIEVARRLAGKPAAEALQRHYGGTRLYVPTVAVAGDPISAIVGIDAARPIIGEIGGIQVDVPMGFTSDRSRHREIVFWASWAGARSMAVARLCGISERQVYNIRAALRARGLFPERAAA